MLVALAFATAAETLPAKDARRFNTAAALFGLRNAHLVHFLLSPDLTLSRNAA